MVTAKLIKETASEMGMVVSHRQALEILLCVAGKMLLGKTLKIAVKECLFSSWKIPWS